MSPAWQAMNVLFFSVLHCSGCVTGTSGLLSFLIENLLNNWLLWCAALIRIVFLLYAAKHLLVCFNGLRIFVVTRNDQTFVYGGLFLIFYEMGIQDINGSEEINTLLYVTASPGSVRFGHLFGQVLWLQDTEDKTTVVSSLGRT